MKTIPCFICKKEVELKDPNAIAKLCKDCNTDANKILLKAVPIRQLLRNLDEGLDRKIESVSSKSGEAITKISQEIAKMDAQLTDIRMMLNNTQTEQKKVVEGASIKEGTTLNEYGEIV